MTGSKHIIRRKPQRGFALLVAIVLSSVAAVITFALSSLAYKNLVLASDASQSQFAFYAADSALECALQGDKGNLSFKYQSGIPFGTSIRCERANTVTFQATRYNGATEYYSDWFPVNTDGTGSRCARLRVYKDASNNTSIYAEGLNVACTDTANPRALERGIKASYGS